MGGSELSSRVRHAWFALVAAAAVLLLVSAGPGWDVIGNIVKDLSRVLALLSLAASFPFAVAVFRQEARLSRRLLLVAASVLPVGGVVVPEQVRAWRFERDPVRRHSSRLSGLCYGLERGQVGEAELRQGWADLGRLRAETGARSPTDDATWLLECASGGGASVLVTGVTGLGEVARPAHDAGH